MTDFRALLATLVEHGVEFIVVGGVAATIHGASRLTRDVDVVYLRADANLDRLVAALAPYRPYLRDVPPGLPFRLDRGTLRRGLNFTLSTDLGAIDLLGEIVGGGGYEALLSHSVAIKVYGLSMRCLGLEKLIEVTRAAGRPRDLEAVAELEAIREEAGRRSD